MTPYLGHPIVLVDSADGLIHEVDVDALLAEIIDEVGGSQASSSTW